MSNFTTGQTLVWTNPQLDGGLMIVSFRRLISPVGYAEVMTTSGSRNVLVQQLTPNH